MFFQAAFNKCLSQKIRHIRHAIKRKSQGAAQGNAPASKRSCFRVLDFNQEAQPAQTTIEDVERHLHELKLEWAKDGRSPSHLKTLLKATRQDRVDFLQRTPNGSIHPLFERYPCFEDGNLVINSQFRILVQENYIVLKCTLFCFRKWCYLKDLLHKVIIYFSSCMNLVLSWGMTG